MLIITTKSVEKSTYFPFFAQHGEAMTVVYLNCTSHGQTTVLGLSQREDETEWYVDSRIESNGFPVFVHGEGDRSCAKQVAKGDLLAAVLRAVSE